MQRLIHHELRFLHSLRGCKQEYVLQALPNYQVNTRHSILKPAVKIPGSRCPQGGLKTRGVYVGDPSFSAEANPKTGPNRYPLYWKVKFNLLYEFQSHVRKLVGLSQNRHRCVLKNIG